MRVHYKQIPLYVCLQSDDNNILLLQVDVRGYEFLNNEYRPFALNYKRTLCSFLEVEYKHMFYPDLVRIGAIMPEPKCPIPAVCILFAFQPF